MQLFRSRREPLLDNPDAEGGFARTVSSRPPSLEERTSCFGRLGFTWFTPIVDLAVVRDREGQKLEPTDIYRLTRKDEARRQLERLEHEWEIELLKPEPSLGAAARRAFGCEVLATAWIKLLNDGLHFVGPFLLNKIIRHIQDQSNDTVIVGPVTISMGYVYAFFMILSSFSQAFLMAHYFQMGYRTGMRMRAALILMAYKKALRVLPWPTPTPPQQEQQEQPRRRRCFGSSRPKPPRAVGGMGQMTNLISADTDKFTFLMPYFNLFWSAPLQLVLCFAMLVAYVSWALIAGVFVMFFFTALSGWVQGKARKVQAEAMKAKDERLKLEVELLKIVKIIKLCAWEDAIERRVKELRDKEMALQLKYKLWSVSMFLSFSLSPSIVALATFACYTLVLGHILDAPTAFTALSLFNILTFPLGAMPMMARFFMEARVAKDRLEAFYLAPEVGSRPRPPQTPGVVISLKAQELLWPDKSILLKGVDLSVNRGQFVAVVGKTGAGKSGLLYAMLGELPIDATAGSAALSGSIGYCAQQAWVRNATLKDNITSGLDVSESRYAEVLDACALRQDLASLPQGDATMIGDRGINLSGGQKQRVALARAVCANPDIYILDDVLSALDAHVANHICTKLFLGPLLQGKTILLVTHSRRALQNANHIIAIGDAKTIAFSGKYEDFRNSGFMDALEEQGDEQRPVHAGGADAPGSGDTPGEKTADRKEGGVVKGDKPKSATAPKPAGGQQDERASGAVSWRVYKAYVSACGGVIPVGFFLLTVALSEGSKNMTDAWLTKWSNSGGAASGAAVYALCAFVSLCGGMAYVITRVFVGQAGSRRLHEQCVRSLLRAKMTFFDLTPNGQILNRLAEDTNILDYNLPQTMAANLVWFWRSAAIVVVCMLVGWYLIFLIVPMFYLYSRLARRYLPATRDLRRLDAAGRSPIFSHFSETMAGVSTVRAMQQEGRMFDTKVFRLESQMEAYYLSNTAARWLSLRLQFNGTILVGAVATLGIAASDPSLQTHLSAGVVGLAITYALKLTDTLNQVNRESADRETQMVSVERVHRFAVGIEQEAALRVDQPLPANWPARGEVNLSDVKMRYRDSLPLVLKGVSLQITGGDRVGIVGRTGCGKSSLLMTLMRLTEIEGGGITIDGVDTQTVGLHNLREKAAIIPQDPAILTGTVRFNLDPFAALPDAQLWDALKKAQLKDRVEAAGGLDSKVEEGGSNFSTGELQLMCLARALLRKREVGGLLLLDEATSALDADTDKIIQQVIRAEFDCTTITIAHRIQTLMDYDKVVVLDAGRVKEVGKPQDLLRMPRSEFKALATEDGVAGEWAEEY